MSSRTRTRKTRTTTTATTTGSARTLRSVPDVTTEKVRTDTEDRLWEALHANPNSTAADLSAAAKIGKSTAQKILVKWAGDGSVTRTAGIADGGRRAADRWAITDLGVTPVAADRGDADSADTAQADPDSPAAPDDTDPAAPAGGEPTEPANPEPADAAAGDTLDSADTEASDSAQAESAAAEAAESTGGGAATNGDPATDGGGDDKATRLAPGALRGMVEDHLRDHPGEQFGPTAIAKALGGKSSGAVSNALDKLVADGTAVKTQDKPRRFALAPAEVATAAAPTN
ncbi:MarR family transcriptional regulator [Amycolatopsis sp. K13G38]|uniref:MarR family transcriptional regulator n=1 Tax=Amycolatopsis acididurans TaxID=2724524 RepID=A0ABX1JL82_9PSEU|nr:helix-turn-helix domain-containing protein [Amycolatopsis acididurans]NKQ59017.1 MarR family transcriptional regulator [Amycolatopsis acididurans]